MLESIGTCEYLSLAEACKRIPTRPGVNTLKRWNRRGYKGVKLQVWKVGRRTITSIAAVDEFLAQLNGTQTQPQATPSSVEAEAVLDRLGV